MYKEEQTEILFNKVCELIESGLSLRSVLMCDTIKALTIDKSNLSSRTFYNWVDSNEKFAQQYARSRELQAENYFDKIMECAFNTDNDITTDESGKTIINHANVNRSRLQVDSLKWCASKMLPKKYGDSLNIESKNENINENKVQTIKIVRINKDEVKE